MIQSQHAAGMKDRNDYLALILSSIPRTKMPTLSNPLKPTIPEGCTYTCHAWTGASPLRTSKVL